MGFLDKNVTPAKTYISTQWAWNLPVYFLISSPISLLSICPHFVFSSNSKLFSCFPHILVIVMVVNNYNLVVNLYTTLN